MSARNNQKQNKKTSTLKTLLVWDAPNWPFKKRNHEFFSTVGTVVFLLVIILIFFKEWLLITVIIALVFVTYVLATIQPEKISHRITNRGISTGGKNYSWEELVSFWFDRKQEQDILYVETKRRFPRRLILLLGKVTRSEVKKVLSNYLLFAEPEKTWIDKSASWLSQKFPLE